MMWTWAFHSNLGLGWQILHSSERELGMCVPFRFSLPPRPTPESSSSTEHAKAFPSFPQAPYLGSNEGNPSFTPLAQQGVKMHPSSPIQEGRGFTSQASEKRVCNASKEGKKWLNASLSIRLNISLLPHCPTIRWAAEQNMLS